MDELSYQNYYILNENQLNSLVVYVNPRDPDFEKFVNSLKTVRLLFSLLQNMLDKSSDFTLIQQQLIQFQNLKLQVLSHESKMQYRVPTAALYLKNKQLLTFCEQKTIDEYSLSKFVSGFVNNKIKPFQPWQDMSHPVTKEIENAYSDFMGLNHEEFYQKVIEHKTNVLVWFYSDIDESSLMFIEIVRKLFPKIQEMNQRINEFNRRTPNLWELKPNLRIYTYEIAYQHTPDEVYLSRLPDILMFHVSRSNPIIEFDGDISSYDEIIEWVSARVQYQDDMEPSQEEVMSPEELEELSKTEF